MKLCNMKNKIMYKKISNALKVFDHGPGKVIIPDPFHTYNRLPLIHSFYLNLNTQDLLSPPPLHIISISSPSSIITDQINTNTNTTLLQLIKMNQKPRTSNNHKAAHRLLLFKALKDHDFKIFEIRSRVGVYVIVF